MSLSLEVNFSPRHNCPVRLAYKLISRTFLANEQYFSLTTNQSTVLSVIAYQPSERGKYLRPLSQKDAILGLVKSQTLLTRMNPNRYIILLRI